MQKKKKFLRPELKVGKVKKEEQVFLSGCCKTDFSCMNPVKMAE